MTKELWVNLPVRDLAKSKEFFTKLGFTFNPQYSNSDEAACLVIGDKRIIVMLFTESTFENFTQNKVSDSKRGTEVLLSIDAETREEVDQMVEKVLEAGGVVYSQPKEEQDWLYGCGFVDLDGHRWNVLYMDMSKMPEE